MRVVGHIPHPSIRITVFMMNEKYIVKLEAGPMEQTFKFEKDIIKGMDDVKKIFDEEFLNKAISRFNEMFLEIKKAREKIS